MDTPSFIWVERSIRATPRRSLGRKLLRTLKLYWKHTIVIAAAPGGAWLIVGLLTTDALVLGARASNNSSEMTPVSAIAGVPFSVMRGHWCRCGPIRDWMVAKRDPQGIWSILPCTSADEYQEQFVFCYDDTPTPDTATVTIKRGSSSAIGLWSPLIGQEIGRAMTVRSFDPKFTAADEKAIRAAAVASWSRPQNHVYVYSSALNPTETTAALAGIRPVTHSLRGIAVANDAAVAGLFTLLFASQPRRARRRRELRAAPAPRIPLTHCSACRYDLTGLNADSYGDRTCPECGCVCGAFS